MEPLYCQKTIDTYNKHANENTEDNGNFPPWEAFLMPYLKKGDHILDLGCGDGHYSKIFQNAGFKISAIDAAEVLCKIASQKLGIHVRNLRFDQLTDVKLYDAVWACCSLLHIPRRAMPDAFTRIATALKPTGYVYASFMEGEEEGFRGNFCTFMASMTEEIMQKILSDIPTLSIIEVKRTPCKYQAERLWIHFILKKSAHTK
ncbi:MAG: class I SAM-dependent methyltransferase [Christensenellales bacterium]|jgi:2-polyprenyl-3-methyl-5-hydroxy-6-metoxy-1,4-benzoquinol methylase